MIDPENVPNVEQDEVVARFILQSKLWYAADGTPKPKLFYPYPHEEHSVNRHLDCSEEEIWNFGLGVANYCGKTLHGRSDISVADCTFDSLGVKKDPIKDHLKGVPDNPNHANIVGYPDNKEDQMSLAQKLAAKAGKRLLPPEDSNE